MAVAKPGEGADVDGQSVVDPTKNVEDLVKALKEALKELRTGDQRFLDAQLASMEKLQNFARNTESKYQDFARNAESTYQNGMRGAETRRIDQLAETRQEFQNTIRDMLAESVRTTSTLVSTQLVQIQATFDSRVSKLEAAQWQSAGRSSVADPALADILARMSAAMTEMQLAQSHGAGSTVGKHDQSKDSRDYIVMGVGIASLVLAVLIAVGPKLFH